MRIEELINKYFEGETTCEEERELRHFFSQGSVPEHLQIYRPLFGFLEEENKGHRATTGKGIKKSITHRRRVLYSLSGIAAGLLLLMGVAGVQRHFNSNPETYVIIDGKQYTNPEMAREQAMAAFRDVSFSEDEVFSTLFDE